MVTGSVDDETRRRLLKLLGVTGGVAVGTANLTQVRAAMASPGPSEPLASTGAALHDDLGGDLDADFLSEQARTFAEAATGLNDIADDGVPADQREDFAPVAEAGRPIVDHLDEAGFYARTHETLPEFTTSYIEDSVQRFASESVLADPLADLGFEGGDGVDMLATVQDKTEELVNQHWIATEQYKGTDFSRKIVGYGDYVPAMTQAAHEGSLLWLQDLDLFLWQNAVLVTDEIYRDAVWYARAMAAGFHLVTEGAIAVAEADGTYDDEQLAALLSVGFAVQTIADPSILQDVHWIRDHERAPRRDDLERAEVRWR